MKKGAVVFICISPITNEVMVTRKGHQGNQLQKNVSSQDEITVANWRLSHRLEGSHLVMPKCKGDGQMWTLSQPAMCSAENQRAWHTAQGNTVNTIHGAVSILFPVDLITPPASPLHSHCLVLHSHPCLDQRHLLKDLKCILIN